MGKGNKHLLTAALILFSFFIRVEASAQANDETTDLSWLKKGLNISKTQLRQAAKFYRPGEHPRSIWPDMAMRVAVPEDWTSGFFPGSLWFMYEITNEDFFKKQAEVFTEALESVKNLTHTHDLGFMLNCSFGNGYRLTGNKEYKDVLITGTQSLANRYSETVGSIRSWDFEEYNFPVIVDNMMNLELLMWASKEVNEKQYSDIAISHANHTLKDHFRKDYSSYHVVDYNPKTGAVERKMTHQGYADDSAWSRGQGWALYGYVMMYRETGIKQYLEQAKNIAAFIMEHPKLPKDKIPYWDFDAPHVPHARRDVSAATIIASSLLELSTIEGSKDYFSFAESILQTLSDDFYMSQPNENGFFILKRSVGNFRNYSEIDTPINYADYYYLEALIRYANILEIDLATL